MGLFHEILMKLAEFEMKFGKIIFSKKSELKNL